MREILIPLIALTPHGGGRVLVELANVLAREGWRVTILTTRYPGEMPFELDAGILIKRIGPKSKSRSICAAAFLLLSPFYMRRKNVLANYFITSISAWLSYVFLQANYLYFVQDIESRFFAKKSQWLLRNICEWSYRRGHLVPANPYLANKLKGRGQCLLQLNIGVASSFFTHPLEINEKNFDVIYFLRAQPMKRLDRFDGILDILNKKNLRVLCVSQNKILLSAYSDKTQTCAPLNDRQLINAIDSARILLLTSEHEGFALPPLEAMARGLPSVMYECGGPSVYAKDGYNSFIVEDGKVETIVARIESLISDDVSYHRMSESSIKTARLFRLEDALVGFEKYMQSYFYQS